MTILGLAESFKTVNRPGPTWPGSTLTLFDSLFIGQYKDRNVKFWNNLHSRLRFLLSIFEIDIFDSLETMRLSAM